MMHACMMMMLAIRTAVSVVDGSVVVVAADGFECVVVVIAIVHFDPCSDLSLPLFNKALLLPLPHEQC